MEDKNEKDISITSNTLMDIDIQYFLREEFFDEMNDSFENDMIHMDAVSDAFDKVISKYIK